MSQPKFTKRLNTKVINYFNHPFSKKRKTETQKGYESVKYVFDKNVCYCHLHALPDLFNSNDIKKPFILITEAADQMLTADARNIYIGDAANPQILTISRDSIPDTIVKWFSTMVNFNHNDVIECCPIGIYDGYFNNGKSTNLIEKIRSENIEKTTTALMNFNINGRQDRKKLHNFAEGKSWITVCDNLNKSYSDVLIEIAKSKFVFCPISNGIETSRIWESIYLGAIPIVQDSNWVRHFTTLPLFVVSDWLDVNQSVLNDIWNSFNDTNIVFDYKLIDEKYWKKRITEESKNCESI